MIKLECQNKKPSPHEKMELTELALTNGVLRIMLTSVLKALVKNVKLVG